MELSLEPASVFLDALLDRLEGEAKAVLFSRDHVDDLPPAGHNRPQSPGFLGGQLSNMRSYTRSEESETTGVDGVCLRQSTGALGEVPRLSGVGDDDRNGGCGEGRRSGELEATRCLHDDQVRSEGFQMGHQLEDADEDGLLGR